MPRTPAIGSLRDVVEVQRPKSPATADESGAWLKDDAYWETFERVRACVRDLAGGELWVARQVIPEVDVLVDLRYLAGLTSEMRLRQVHPVVRTLQIKAVVNPDGRRIWSLVYAKV